MIHTIVDFILSTGIYGVIFSSIIIIIESILPIIPVFVFISINFLILGKFWGFIISWISVIIGCLISYYIFKNGFTKHFERLTMDKDTINKYKKELRNISTDKLILIIAFPFTPAFIVNIVAGLTKMDFKKYLIALIFGKISLVIYSAFLGSSFIECFTNPLVLIKLFVVIMLVYICYIITKKIFKLNI